MEVGTECKKLKSFKIITLSLLILAATASSQNTTTCPFEYYYQFGDGFTDIGNSIRILPSGPSLPAARLPYGKTFPGNSTGRWSDGRIDVDYAAAGVGLPNIRSYLSLGPNPSSARDGVVFSVARSPVLRRRFFIQRGIVIPSYATPLASQINWFRNYLESVSLNPRERVANSLIVFAYVESLDIAYALVQGKSIQEVTTYVTSIIRTQINTAIRLIEMGARRIVISGDGPLGCYPYILTALPSTNSSAYDALGCLTTVNALIISKNDALQQAINDIKDDFPNVTILYSDTYQATTTVTTQMIASGAENIGLKACCGIGGRYNYNSSRFCGSPGVPVCDNPNQYIHWDGMHYTQEVYRRIVNLMIGPALIALNCTS